MYLVPPEPVDHSLDPPLESRRERLNIQLSNPWNHQSVQQQWGSAVRVSIDRDSRALSLILLISCHLHLLSVSHTLTLTPLG